jgi:hypothetical protein
VKLLAADADAAASSWPGGVAVGSSGSERSAVRDVVFVMLLVAFFAAAVGLVRVCERIVGGGDAVALRTDAEPARDEVAA